MNIEKIYKYKINSEYPYVFGYDTNTWHTISEVDIQIMKDNGDYEAFVYELSTFDKMGILEVIEKPEIGDTCYFWNIPEGKMKSTIDNKPFVAKLIGFQGEKFVPEDCHFVFNFAEKV